MGKVKLSVVVSNYNTPHGSLKNTFTGLSRQKTDFEFEVCFFDDCSYDDPKPIYDEFLKVKNKSGMRLKQHIGNLGITNRFDSHPWFKPGAGMALEMAKADIVVIMHSDILIADDDAFQKFIDRMKPKVLQVPRIFTRDVDPNLYLDFEGGIEKAMEEHPTTDMLYQDTIPPREYQGPALMPFLKKTLLDIDYPNNVHEIDLSQKYLKLGYSMEPSDVRAVHQKHANMPNIFATHSQCMLHWREDCPERVYY